MAATVIAGTSPYSSGCNAGIEEAKIVLAAYFLRFARLEVEDLPDKDIKLLAFDRHAYAVVVAERIVQTIAVHNGTEGNDECVFE